MTASPLCGLSAEDLIALILAHAAPLLPLEARDPQFFETNVRVTWSGRGRMRASLGVRDLRHAAGLDDLLGTTADVRDERDALLALANLLRERLARTGAAEQAAAITAAFDAARREQEFVASIGAIFAKFERSIRGRARPRGGAVSVPVYYDAEGDDGSK